MTKARHAQDSCTINLPIFLGQSVAACSGIEMSDADVYQSPLCLVETPKEVVVLDLSFGLGISLDVGLNVVGAPLAKMSMTSGCCVCLRP